jgi:dGTPase
MFKMKEDYLRFEREFLSPYAQKSEETRGRAHALQPCPLRTEFQRDRDRIIHCKAFRRLKHKTQVFLSPEDDHFRTRLTHTLEVTQIARTLARALLLNEDLTEAVALGHDLGHTPFGHAGERALSKKTGHFAHNEQSLRVVERMENEGKGLNLTVEVRDGILNHRLSGKPLTAEGRCVQLADKIAYLNHDIDDAVRAGILRERDLPKESVRVLGNGRGNMINSIVSDIVKQSYGLPLITQSKEYEEAMAGLRNFMFQNVYASDSPAKKEEIKAERIIEKLFDYYKENQNKIPALYKTISEDENAFICDFIAGMTDNYAIKTFKDIFIPDKR